MFLFILDVPKSSYWDLDSNFWNVCNVKSKENKCEIDYINYNKSTIFHHNFFKTKLDSSTYGFFFNKKYPAIMTKVFFSRAFYMFNSTTYLSVYFNFFYFNTVLSVKHYLQKLRVAIKNFNCSSFCSIFFSLRFQTFEHQKKFKQSNK